MPAESNLPEDNKIMAGESDIHIKKVILLKSFIVKSRNNEMNIIIMAFNIYFPLR